ncbi:uncharacterized protein LOC110275053 [Arachis duranensis]|uniref:Uncharacterized protein LOC110275053 n=1 Tax=Arachis duranensis TaxID=130453 RepID=A0A9C6TJ83_ARADU|nr:uncharacterized protein LOC110275053 [Arachis duranensis]XP_052109754.1 uncharacterized protein LOC110275053 [Arachis duranensis]
MGRRPEGEEKDERRGESERERKGAPGEEKLAAVNLAAICPCHCQLCHSEERESRHQSRRPSPSAAPLMSSPVFTTAVPCSMPSPTVFRHKRRTRERGNRTVRELSHGDRRRASDLSPPVRPSPNHVAVCEAVSVAAARGRHWSRRSTSVVLLFTVVAEPLSSWLTEAHRLSLGWLVHRSFILDLETDVTPHV